MSSAIPDTKARPQPKSRPTARSAKAPVSPTRKSRTGCQRCRARRVKCDETRPVCRDCHRHGIPCVYDRPAGRSNLAHSSPRIKDCWSIDVPQLAFDYKPLLHAIFAISALHLSKANPNDAGLPDIHCHYLEQALREHRLCIGGIVDVFATLQNRPVVSYDHASEWMRLVHGSVAVFDAALEIARHKTHPASIWLAYRGAVAHFNATWLAMEAKEHPQISRRRLMAFPLFVITEFIGLLEKRRPRALVVLAYFLALSAPVRDIWWIEDAAHKYVVALNQSFLPVGSA
ncbi:hypothetical protein BO82DRAFT_377863 [Aspergillus uvarum CBS 121591]|uniref:Zn(2)-C6 fungal-type domain-containing protein n=1 Tax=Aspergillus uvarum CBS 121591 TaxID=1448315 RepID=A0A319DCX1_9EURO|nr:hypothetical protein BO82DRAFT_377863 [Aspergillus uvarum CBS 121591]PYH77712.1 hypothetical protein BO82DRAFT_377863 [Aspergillus uvarum CBS 121591]